MLLDREEYVEQAYFYRTLRERMQQGMSSQELVVGIRQELLSTARLTLALDFMAGELKFSGGFAGAIARLNHYFTPFQATSSKKQRTRRAGSISAWHWRFSSARPTIARGMLRDRGCSCISSSRSVAIG